MSDYAEAAIFFACIESFAIFMWLVNREIKSNVFMKRVSYYLFWLGLVGTLFFMGCMLALAGDASR